MENLINNIKDKGVEIKDTAVIFCKEHKEEIFLVAALILTTCGWVYFGRKYHTAETIIKEKDVIIEGKDSMIKILSTETARLKKLCNAKDEIMASTMSDGFRCGSSECGRQMAYKRWN